MQPSITSNPNTLKSPSKQSVKSIKSFTLQSPSNQSVKSSKIDPSTLSISQKTIHIKHLPKDKLLFLLWKYAKPAQYFYYCKNLIPKLKLSTVRFDICHMIENNRPIHLTTYQGKLIYCDLSDDDFDPYEYNAYNGAGLAEKIINYLQTKELRRIILRTLTLL